MVNVTASVKDLSHEVAREVCATARQAGTVPVMLDWDRRFGRGLRSQARSNLLKRSIVAFSLAN
jgi:hypothetical protein